MNIFDKDAVKKFTLKRREERINDYRVKLEEKIEECISNAADKGYDHVYVYYDEVEGYDPKLINMTTISKFINQFQSIGYDAYRDRVLHAIHIGWER